MKIGRLEITYMPFSAKAKVKTVYMLKRDREASYKAYRDLTGAGIAESHRIVRGWMKGWEVKGK